MEVMTPNLGRYGVTSPNIQNIQVQMGEAFYFLQTSPEYAMKRLLAEGSGAIYQITSAFRGGESGNRHNPEFTLLEWYRPSLNLQGLMEELDELLSELCTCFQIQRGQATFVTYRDLFEFRFGENPHQLTLVQSLKLARQHFPNLMSHLNQESGVDDVLDLLFSAGIEPTLIEPHFVYNYPVSQAALAKIGLHCSDKVSLRFELFWKGMELANGYDELKDAKELSQRFVADNNIRASKNLKQVSLDDTLLSALEFMPDCTGVALGLDRLQMLLTDQSSIKDVLSFPIENA
ncbi:MAG: lysyl-tRNA synthetase class 2 [Candidatus Azotimanducaceae bacterium]|jgi:lysyl-tRNA synthetase class 2